jgi:hypothetical protein
MIKITNIGKFIVIFGSIAILLSACRLGIEVESINKERAEIIISALYEYEGEHNSFPNELSDLVPDYLEEIPTTTGGQTYFYLTNSTDGFFLAFDMNSHYGCGYTDKFKEWECSSGD